MNFFFTDVRVIDWYDNILKAFCIQGDALYYCSLLYLNWEDDTKVYVCINVKYFEDADMIRNIYLSDKTAEYWTSFYNILNKVKSVNKSYLIKTKDLGGKNNDAIPYQDDFNWNREILFSDFPEVLDEAQLIDSWLKYWADSTSS